LSLGTKFGSRAPDGADDFDLDDRARKLIGVAFQQLAEGKALGLLDDELYER
jgi:hypothetical protein